MRQTDAIAEALQEFKRATSKLGEVWERDGDGDELGDSYPSYLPGFSEFAADVAEMQIKPRLTGLLPEMPPVGSIVRARDNLHCGGHFIWPKGWTGEIVNAPAPGYSDSIEIRAHRYLGPGAHEWDNCRLISLDDAVSHFVSQYGPLKDATDYVDRILAFALLHEFEVLS